jgi:hypothetical protein
MAAAAAFGIAHGYQGLAGILMDLRTLLGWPVNGLVSAPQE